MLDAVVLCRIYYAGRIQHPRDPHVPAAASIPPIGATLAGPDRGGGGTSPAARPLIGRQPRPAEADWPSGGCTSADIGGAAAAGPSPHSLPEPAVSCGEDMDTATTEDITVSDHH